MTAQSETVSASSADNPNGFKILRVGTRPESVTKGWGGHYYVTVMGDQQPGGLDGRERLAVDVAPRMACPNGVCAPAPDRLLIAEFFHGNLLRARNGKLETLNTGFRGADGIE